MAQARFDFARYMNIRAAYAPEFTPDGRTLLFLTNITGVPQLWAQSLVGGWPRQLTYYEERIGGARAGPDGAVLFSMDEGGNEHDQLFLLSADGSIVTPLTNDPTSIHRPGRWAPDGRRFAYAVNNRDKRFFDIYLLDLGEGDGAVPRLLLQDDHTNAPGSWSPDGRRLIIRRTYKPANADLFLLEVETGELTHLTPHEGDVRYEDAAFDRDGAALFIMTDKERDFLAPARLTIATRAIEWLDDAPWDAEGLSMSPDARRIAYTLNEDGYSRLCLRDVTTGAALPAPDLPPGIIQAGMMPGPMGGRFAWSPDSRQIAFTYQSSTHHMNVWLYAPDTGELRQVTFAPDGGIPSDCYVTPEIVRYPTFDGLQIPALYYRPRGTQGKLPVVVLVHGGPESQSRPIFNPTVQYFVNRGYAVFLPNVRGSTGYGKAYSHLDDVRKRMDSVRDLVACVDWLTAHGDADRERIAVMGGSYGGFMTLAGVANYPDLWAAGVDMVGIGNFLDRHLMRA